MGQIRAKGTLRPKRNGPPTSMVSGGHGALPTKNTFLLRLKVWHQTFTLT